MACFKTLSYLKPFTVLDYRDGFLYPCIILLLTLIVNVSSAKEFTKIDTNKKINQPYIEYSFGDGQMHDVMPFDDSFVFKITGVPGQVDSLTLAVYEIRGNYNLFKNKHSITYKEFKQMDFIRSYEAIPWKRSGKDTLAYIPFPYHLKPNCRYVIELTVSNRDKLKPEEKEDVRTVITNSTKIKKLITGYAKEFINNPNSKFSKNISFFQNDLNEIIKQEVKNVNKNYQFNAPENELDQLRPITGFFISLANFSTKVNELSQDTALSDGKVKKLRTISEFHFGELVFNEKYRIYSDNIIDSLNNDSLPPTTQLAIQGVQSNYKQIIDSAKKAADIIIEKLAVENTYTLYTMGSNYPLSMTEQADRYIGLDFGLAYVGNFSRFESYYGLNIHFRPVNKNIPLSRYKSFSDFMLARTSLLFGVTFASVEETNIRKGILGDKGIIIGSGFKIVSFLRVNAGALIYYRYPNNPLIDPARYKTKLSPFISASFDLDMESLLGVFGKALFPAKN